MPFSDLEQPGLAGITARDSPGNFPIICNLFPMQIRMMVCDQSEDRIQRPINPQPLCTPQWARAGKIRSSIGPQYGDIRKTQLLSAASPYSQGGLLSLIDLLFTLNKSAAHFCSGELDSSGLRSPRQPQQQGFPSGDGITPLKTLQKDQ